MNTCVLLLSCLDKLNQREEITFTILKPGFFVWPYRRDTIDGLQGRHIVLFKDDPVAFESGNFGLDIVYQPDRLGVGPEGLTLRGEYRESGDSGDCLYPVGDGTISLHLDRRR
jgi:hypothetical protein